MSGRITGESSLPVSHVFLTAACGSRQRTIAVPRWAALGAAALFMAAALWSCGCTLYLASHDTLLAASMRRERELHDGFEDRIAALQRALERTSTEHAQLERTVGTRLDALAGQEADLRRRADKVATLAADVLHLAGRPSTASQQAASAPGTAALPLPSATPPRSATARDQGERVSSLSTDFSAIAADQDRQIGRLQTATADRVALYRDALAGAGLSEARFGHDANASGGPFVPLDPKRESSGFDRSSLALEGALAQAAQLRSEIARTPFDKPLAGDPEITSPFGPRLDPFLGRPALHTGIDLREDSGTAVLATAPGRVVFAGTASGYGTMVEIDHGAGLSTRYAHLSATEVEVGQSVAAGAVVGRVGATGRATGPHLHYETRIDGEPVDPMRFLRAGYRLAQGEVH